MKAECIGRLVEIGIKYQDAVTLRRIAMTLHNWHEKECGFDNGCIERDEQTGIAYWLASTGRSGGGHRWPDQSRSISGEYRTTCGIATTPRYVAPSIPMGGECAGNVQYWTEEFTCS